MAKGLKSLVLKTRPDLLGTSPGIVNPPGYARSAAMADKQEIGKIQEAVRHRYAQAAQKGSPCGCGCWSKDSFSNQAIASAIGYSQGELEQVPKGANLGLGCGNPGALAMLQPGQVVLDLGSGGGFDAFLAAARVGPTGRVIGVDMTKEMLELARRNAAKAGHHNVEFRRGAIEDLPLADEEVDWIISNCVINLSADKPAVLAESFRVLKPGGRLAISDIVALGELPAALKEDLALWTACAAGAVPVGEFEQMLKEAGFGDVCLEPSQASRQFIDQWAPGLGLGRYLASAAITAQKPSPA